MLNFRLTASGVILLVSVFASSKSSNSSLLISKYCPIGQVLVENPDKGSRLECAKVVAGVNWTGVLYDNETLKRLDPSQNKQIERTYSSEDLICKDDAWIWISAKPSVQMDEMPL